MRHFKKTFLASFIAVSPFFLSAAEIVQGDHAVAETAKSIAISNTSQAKINASIAIGEKVVAQGSDGGGLSYKAGTSLPLVKIVQLKVAQLHSVKVQKVMYWVTWH